jgi:hypothetical protein
MWHVRGTKQQCTSRPTMARATHISSATIAAGVGGRRRVRGGRRGLLWKSMMAQGEGGDLAGAWQ